MENLTAKELRIGNYIMSGNNGKFQSDGIIGKILEIGNEERDFEQIYCECDESFEWFFKDNYFGIPLTEQVLIDCGFEEIYRSAYRLKFDHENYHEFGYDFSFTENGHENGFRFYGRHIKCEYLHQLQNIFNSLSGQELEYKPKDGL